MRLDVYSDTICPWCYIGKRRFERALAARPQANLSIRWRAFMLNPSMPPEGMDRRAYIQAKFGGAGRAQRLYQALASAGASVGLAFDFERLERTPNTLDSHRLLRYAAERGCQDAVVEGLFAAYFVEGRDIGDASVLVEVAAAAGLDGAVVRRRLAGDSDVEAVLAEDTLARHQGVTGVPCFIFNGRYMLSGAQEPEAFMQLFDLAREDDAERLESGRQTDAR